MARTGGSFPLPRAGGALSGALHVDSPSSRWLSIIGIGISPDHSWSRIGRFPYGSVEWKALAGR